VTTATGNRLSYLGIFSSHGAVEVGAHVIPNAQPTRQIEWARVEVGRQASHTALMLILAGAAAIAGLGAAVVGLVALFAMEHGQFIALGMIGGGSAADAYPVRVSVCSSSSKVRIAAAATNRATRGSAWHVGTGPQCQGPHGHQQVLDRATDTLRHGCRSALFGTLVPVALVGLIAARRFKCQFGQGTCRIHSENIGDHTRIG
jgi:hypothetical protein